MALAAALALATCRRGGDDDGQSGSAQAGVADRNGADRNRADRSGRVRIPEGPFAMGVDDPRGPDEGPARVVRLGSFYIDRTEVANQAFAAFVAATGYATQAEADTLADRSWRRPAGGQVDAAGERLRHPVVYVTWRDAAAYCAWRGGRLPTEAEWEKAARGGDGRLWPWGNDADSTRANAWGRGDGFPQTAPVGSFPGGASPYGLLDAAGNVWEWCADRYDPDYYVIAPRRDPPGPDRGELRVVRGGSWTNPIAVLRAANRHAVNPEDASPYVGFRCAADP